MHTTIIAEAGVNHNGSMTLAKQMVEKAKQAGADYVKFQTFVPEKLVSRFAQKAEYQKKTTGAAESQLQMLQKLALTQEDFIKLQAYCKTVGIGFLSHRLTGKYRIFRKAGYDFWKLLRVKSQICHIWKRSAAPEEILLCLPVCVICRKFRMQFRFGESGAGRITVLHCNTEYPTAYTDVNLLAMQQMREILQKPVGTQIIRLGIEVPIAAVAFGGNVIEKHFTLDKQMEGPDHRASLEPQELAQMVTAIPEH